MANVTITAATLTEAQKQAYEIWAEQNQGASFDEFCEGIDAAVLENGGDGTDAQFIAEDAMRQLGIFVD